MLASCRIVKEHWSSKYGTLEICSSIDFPGWKSSLVKRKGTTGNWVGSQFPGGQKDWVLSQQSSHVLVQGNWFRSARVGACLTCGAISQVPRLGLNCSPCWVHTRDWNTAYIFLLGRAGIHWADWMFTYGAQQAQKGTKLPFIQEEEVRRRVAKTLRKPKHCSFQCPPRQIP